MKAGLIATLLAILAGAIVPVQVGVNAVLDQQLKSPFFTSFIVFLVGAIGILISFFCAIFITVIDNNWHNKSSRFFKLNFIKVFR